MRKITILAVGKLKETYWDEAQAEFLKRLGPYAKMTMREIPTSPFGASVTQFKAMQEEGKRLMDALPKNALIVTLDRGGDAMSSPQFAEFLTREGDAGREICFVIGGAGGLDKPVLDRADRKISLSEMTFSHDMARIFLLEQLYRGCAILAGKAYHY